MPANHSRTSVPAEPLVHPETPTCTTVKELSSPPVPSLRQLTHFLHYAETHLGVRDATTYERELEIQGIGPDILNVVDDQMLSSMGIPTGDIIRLKRGSTVWWNSSDSKRKRSNTEASSESSGAHPPRKVAYKKHYHDSGGCHFSGPPMQPDDAGNSQFGPVQDYQLFYKCDTQNLWLPVPQGYMVNANAEDKE